MTETDLAAIPKPRNPHHGQPRQPRVAFQTSFLPNDGVGLARMEFIISEAIKAHPMALIHPDRVEDADERKEIERLTARLVRPADDFVEKLSRASVRSPPRSGRSR